MILFYSKHNQVYPTLWNGRGAVEKHFQRREDWERERDVYQTLQLPRPALLEARPNVLVTAYCGFPTLLEELERQEQTGFSAAPWEALCAWLSSCSHLHGLLPAEGNLRNFLWDASQDTVLGLDFENFRPVSLSGSAALLIAALLEYTPADTPMKRQAAALLAVRLHVPTEIIAASRSRLQRMRAARNSLSFSGVILAGGRSSRMGCSKAELELEGKTLLTRQICKMKVLGIQDVLISGASRAVFPDTQAIPDTLPGRGPLGGIHACLEAAQNSRCLVTSVDTPLVPVSALSHLCRSHKDGVTVLCHANGQEPLLGVYDRGAADAAADLIKKQGASVRLLKGKINWSVFDYVGPLEFLKNCNTPRDFSEIKAIMQMYRAQKIFL